jgi:hypothetical protein
VISCCSYGLGWQLWLFFDGIRPTGHLCVALGISYLLLIENCAFGGLKYRFVVLPSSAYLFTAGVRGFFLFSLDHTHTHTTVCMTPLDEGSARRRDLNLKTQTLYKRQTSMPPVGFEPKIPASARPQTHALLDRAATGIGGLKFTKH